MKRKREKKHDIECCKNNWPKKNLPSFNMENYGGVGFYDLVPCLIYKVICKNSKND
jgi:hypothetical protein